MYRILLLIKKCLFEFKAMPLSNFVAEQNQSTILGIDSEYNFEKDIGLVFQTTLDRSFNLGQKL